MRTDVFESVSSEFALTLLKEGNQRFVDGVRCITNSASERRLLADKGQKPFAAILGCSDSRVVPEIIFDVGLGQLFVVRTAGNTAGQVTVGSIEYAAEHLGVTLAVVLGHSNCGAVAAAVSGADPGENIGVIVSEIRPALEKARLSDPSNLTNACEDENILLSVEGLNRSQVLKKLVLEGKLKIVGAKYDLETGAVRFLE